MTTYAVLYSHASSRVWEEMVAPTRYASSAEASSAGFDVARVQGVKFEVMHLDDEGVWRDRRGRDAVTVIREEWA